MKKLLKKKNIPSDVGQKESTKVQGLKEKVGSYLKPAGEKITFTSKKVWNPQKIVVKWAGQQVIGGYALFSEKLISSKRIGKSTGNAILIQVESAYKKLSMKGKKAANHAPIFVNAILASDFSRNMESWLGDMFTTGIPTIYDKAVDAFYNATHLGGGYLHRLFDESHTIWEMWDRIRDALPDDTSLQEVIGYAETLGKDLSSNVGIPLFDLSKSSYDKMADFLGTTFNIPKSWFSDFLHINTTELIGTSIATIAVVLHWNKKRVKEFSKLAGSLGISSIASANPALAIVALVTLSKSFVDARQDGNYKEFIKGLAQGGVGTGAFLATAAAVGGPVWVGLLAGLCVGVIAHKCVDAVEINQINTFIENSLKKTIEQFE